MLPARAVTPRTITAEICDACSHEWFQRNRGADLLRDSRVQKLLIFGVILLLALSHWFIGGPNKRLNNVLYNLNFVPILVGAMLFGWRNAVLTTALTLVSEIPHLWLVFSTDRTYASIRWWRRWHQESPVLLSVCLQARSDRTGHGWKKQRGN